MIEFIKEVIVVEGRHDEAKIKMVCPNCDVIITNGTEISQATLKTLKELNKVRGLLLILDPDFPGDKIRHIINTYAGETKHVFLDKHECIDTVKKKVGLEHASNNYVETVLKANVLEVKPQTNPLTTNDLLHLKLTGNNDAKARRKAISSYFNLGEANAKTLLKRLNMFGIQIEEIKKVLP